MIRFVRRRRFIRAVSVVDTILAVVSKRYGVAVTDIRGPRRFQHFVRPRMLAMFVAWCATGCSPREVGLSFGGRDRGTVIHAIETVEAWMGEDPTVKTELFTIAYLVAGRTQPHLPSPEQEREGALSVVPQVAQQLTDWTGRAGYAIEASVERAEAPVDVGSRSAS